MITLHKLNGAVVTINAELIESIEGSPDTVISLTTGNRYVVREKTAEVVDKIVEYRRQVNAAKKDPLA
jgi:flagellar protein FlbD